MVVGGLDSSGSSENTIATTEIWDGTTAAPWDWPVADEATLNTSRYLMGHPILFTTSGEIVVAGGTKLVSGTPTVLSAAEEDP